MEENMRPNIPSRSADLGEEAERGCGNGLTRTNSDSSAVTIENAPRSSEWTNEKHSLYLDSLEASFVHQLHCSMGLHPQNPKENRWGPYISRGLPANSRTSDQFTVLHDGHWQKINFETSEPLLDGASDRVILGSPWVRHFRSARKRCPMTSPDLQDCCVHGNSTFSCELGRSSDQHHACHSSQQDLVGSIKEVSDQNFVDEHQGEKSSCKAKVKRLKTTAADASSKDHVVPSGKFYSADSSTANNGTSER